MERVFGPYDTDTVMNAHNFGLVLQAQGHLTDAAPVLVNAHHGIRICFGEEHAVTIHSAENLGNILQALGRLGDAEPYVRHVLEVRRKTLDSSARETFESVNNLGLLLFAMKRFEEADPLLREAVAWHHRDGGSVMDCVLSAHNMGSLLQSKVRVDCVSSTLLT